MFNTRSGRGGGNGGKKNFTTNVKPISDHFSPDGQLLKKNGESSQEANNTKILHEILAKIETLTKGIAEVKKEVSDFKTLIKDIVQEELAAREEKWIKERDRQ